MMNSEDPPSIYYREMGGAFHDRWHEVSNAWESLELRTFFFSFQCRADHASRDLFEMINKKPTKIALIGAGCSVVSERLAEATKTWNLVMVSIHGVPNTKPECRW